MTVPRHQPPELDAGDLTVRRRLAGIPSSATICRLGGFYRFVGVIRVQQCHLLVVGWPELSTASSWAAVALGTCGQRCYGARASQQKG